ncbi:MAG: N-6 DNA methylase [bacterium]|nr:N-6 DNA methylase [bacterium]
MSKIISIRESLETFATNVKAKMTQLTTGEPEDQLRGPFENFKAAVAKALGWNIVCIGETRLPNRLGRPDYAVHVKKLLVGYVELKAPGVGAFATRFKGHNREQFKRFSAIPNILYTDGNEWALYRNGELAGRIVRLSGNVAADGKKAVSTQNAAALEHLLRDFFLWQPLIPRDRKGKIDLKAFAALLAPLCRMLRDDVIDALKDPSSPLVELARDWRQLLFPDAPDEQFADAYAQTVTFGLLLGRSEGAEPLTLASAEKALAAQHNLLARALQVLTDNRARAEITTSLDLLLRVIAAVPTAAFIGPEDPWLYFYEHFLSVYDPKLRKDAGAYYTPIEVVHCQVRLIDDLLVNRLNKPLGFADPSVITLDPAAGTGTYLLGVIEHALERVKSEQGKGAVKGQATELAKNIFGFEIMVGPYAVTELRVSRALSDRGASLPADGTHIFLTDTLESPHAEPPQLPFFLRPIAEQHAKALKVKNSVPVIVCLGNPPYDRHEAVDITREDSLARYGGWVRFGDPLPDDRKRDKRGQIRKITSAKARISEREKRSILRDFINPAIAAGHGVHLKNLYNLYVYFWRWALWKVFEHEKSQCPGVVSFISASSYLDGDAFCGMREHMRRICEEIWILDLGGEGRGTRKSENVFAIQTPVAIAVAVRAKKANKDKPARVHYSRIEGDSKTKLAALEAIDDYSKVEWKACLNDWHAPFRPMGKGHYFNWPLLTDIMPWQHTGCEMKRTWPICHEIETLKSRWRALLVADDRANAFKETRDRKISLRYPLLYFRQGDGSPLNHLPRNVSPPQIERYAYRSFDRQWMFADNRIGDYLRPDLWRTHGPKQLYLASSMTLELGQGPALTSAAEIPDRHYFSGRGGRDIVPLYRKRNATQSNILPGLLEQLGKVYIRKVAPEDFAAYLYGVLAQPAFTARFQKELETRELRVPITKDGMLFDKISDIGARLLWLHTYGERFVPKGKRLGQIPPGKAKCVKAVPGSSAGYPESFHYEENNRTLHVGDGKFLPVTPEVYEYEVSGLKVVRSWLKYRMKKGAGKKSSPLDDIRPEKWTSQFTTELLELLWVLEATVECYPEQANLLNAVIEGECFRSDEMPPVPDEMREAPKAKEQEGEQLGLNISQ